VEHIHDGRVHDGRVYSGSVEYTRRSCPYYAGTTVVSVTSTFKITSGGVINIFLVAKFQYTLVKTGQLCRPQFLPIAFLQFC